MHYGSDSFSKNGKPTLRSIKDPARALGQRNGFTQIDIQEINSLYECSSKSIDFKHYQKPIVVRWRGRLLFVWIPSLLRSSKQRFLYQKCSLSWHLHCGQRDKRALRLLSFIKGFHYVIVTSFERCVIKHFGRTCLMSRRIKLWVKSAKRHNCSIIIILLTSFSIAPVGLRMGPPPRFLVCDP